MPPVDRDGVGDDDDLRLYVAAFRRVELPSPTARAATWRAIERDTAPTRRTWLWIGAAAALAAAVVLLFAMTDLRVALLGATQDDPRGEQAGYQEASEETSRPIESPPRRTTRDAEPSIAVEPLPPAIAPVEPAPAEPAPVVETATPSKRRTEPARTLADETVLFREIQQALVEKRPKHALEAIGRHERDFPRGAFRQERVVAKAQALCALGRTSDARRVRDQFLARNASSHLAPRMRAVCPG